MSDNYYIRIRGEVKGPLSREQIVTQIRRKRLGRHHELSADAINWQKAGDMPEFFEPAVTKRARVAVESEADASDTFSLQPAEKEDVSPDSNGDWYYAKGGNKLGPVSGSEIQMWLSSGRLNAEDLVWNESFDNWLPVGDLPQFAGAAGSRKGSGISEQPPAGFWEIFMGTSAAARLPGNAVHKYPNLSRYLQIAESSLRILFVLLLFLNLAGLFYVVGRSWYEMQWVVVAGGLIAAPLQVLFLWLVFITCMAGLEFIRVVIQIEDNTSP
ncbi:MAG: GYF domain-containing protein [Fuerstiella sp.]